MKDKKTTPPQVQTLRRLVAFIDAFADLLEEAGPAPELDVPQVQIEPLVPTRKMPKSAAHARELDAAIARGLGADAAATNPQRERAQRADPEGTSGVPNPIPE